MTTAPMTEPVSRYTRQKAYTPMSQTMAARIISAFLLNMKMPNNHHPAGPILHHNSLQSPYRYREQFG